MCTGTNSRRVPRTQSEHSGQQISAHKDPLATLKPPYSKSKCVFPASAMPVNSTRYVFVGLFRSPPGDPGANPW
eukprot:gene5028-3362_t